MTRSYINLFLGKRGVFVALVVESPAVIMGL